MFKTDTLQFSDYHHVQVALLSKVFLPLVKGSLLACTYLVVA
jgi:hypothetical protein